MTITVGKSITLRILSAPGHLPVVRAATEKLCEMMGFDDETAGQIVLSLDEALANVIEHAYDGSADGAIEVTLTPVGDDCPNALCIRLRDHGRQVDPSKIRPRDLDDVRPGGLGVHIIQQYMDRVDFEPADGGGTILTMVKELPAKGTPA